MVHRYTGLRKGKVFQIIYADLKTKKQAMGIAKKFQEEGLERVRIIKKDDIYNVWAFCHRIGYHGVK